MDWHLNWVWDVFLDWVWYMNWHLDWVWPVDWHLNFDWVGLWNMNWHLHVNLLLVNDWVWCGLNNKKIFVLQNNEKFSQTIFTSNLNKKKTTLTTWTGTLTGT